MSRTESLQIWAEEEEMWYWRRFTILTIHIVCTAAPYPADLEGNHGWDGPSMMERYYYV